MLVLLAAYAIFAQGQLDSTLGNVLGAIPSLLSTVAHRSLDQLVGA